MGIFIDLFWDDSDLAVDTTAISAPGLPGLIDDGGMPAVSPRETAELHAAARQAAAPAFLPAPCFATLLEDGLAPPVDEPWRHPGLFQDEHCKLLGDNRSAARLETLYAGPRVQPAAAGTAATDPLPAPPWQAHFSGALPLAGGQLYFVAGRLLLAEEPDDDAGGAGAAAGAGDGEHTAAGSVALAALVTSN